MNPSRSKTLLATAILTLAHTAATAEQTFTSAQTQAGLLELFTSEGCSSCPPADRWVSSLTSDDRLWHELIPLSFHVDYWDYIGWKDRFASPAFSKRQRRYAAEKAVSTVYTPGFLYNGREWRGWFDGGKSAFPEAGDAGVLRLTVDGEAATVHFRPTQASGARLDVTVAVLGSGLSTKVRAGENAGRELRHDFVVLGLERSRLDKHDGHLAAAVPVPDTDIEAPRYAIVAWVSEAGSPTPLQATGGWLTPD